MSPGSVLPIRCLGPLALLGLGAAISACGPSAEVEFDPPAGAYTSPQQVRVHVPEAEAVYVSIDGREPDRRRCHPHDGSPIELNRSAEIKVLAVRRGARRTTASAEYVIAGEAGEGPGLDLLKAWLKYEAATGKALMDRNNQGAEPGLTSVGKTWSIEDGAGGRATWLTVAEGLGARSTRSYENYEHAGLRVQGSVVGHFDATASGVTETHDQGATLVLSGAHQGTIEDHIVIEKRRKTGGYYVVTCRDEDCGEGELRFVAPDWRVAGGMARNEGGSCPEPWYVIRHASSGRCLVRTEEGGLKASDCDAGQSRQRWQVLQNEGAWALRSDGREGRCLHDRQQRAGDWSVVTEACSGRDRQRWVLLGRGDGAKVRSTTRPACLFSPAWGGDVYATDGNCDLAEDIVWSFWRNGQLDEAAAQLRVRFGAAAR